jgi:hypothetical protein
MGRIGPGNDPGGARLTRLRVLARQFVSLFVADTMLAVFVPAWIIAAWVCTRLLPTLPPGVMAALLAVGPVAALWFSVRHAARTACARGCGRGCGPAPPSDNDPHDRP